MAYAQLDTRIPPTVTLPPITKQSKGHIVNTGSLACWAMALNGLGNTCSEQRKDCAALGVGWEDLCHLYDKPVGKAEPNPVWLQTKKKCLLTEIIFFSFSVLE